MGGDFPCGAATCNGSTSFCLARTVTDTCEPLPAECTCAETLDCACLLAHVPNPCDVGGLACVPRHDGGLHWIEAVACP
jgi:hypothetical protein